MSRQRNHAALPLGALAAGFGLGLISSSAWAQAAEDSAKKVDAALPEVTVKGSAGAQTPVAKQSYQVETTTIGKGKQALRDIPQSITVVTEKLIEDRKLDTLKQALHNTAGVTFQAAEGGEEDIRLRGFSLQATGDIFIDGMRDPAFYERDTFNLDRIELLRGSASMLFGRGSTGGAVNQVSKTPYLENAHEIDTTLGSHNTVRLTGDFNFKTGDNSALRITGMRNTADNNGAGSSIDKYGLAGAFRWGIGSADEFQIGLYHLDNHNGMNYGIPWIKPISSGSNATNTVNTTLSPDAYYGMASDYNDGSANYATLSHQHRFGSDTELKTSLRSGHYTRDQRAGTVRFANTVDLSNIGPSTPITRGLNLKIQDIEASYLQSDLSTKFQTWGLKHALLAGLDLSHEKRNVYTARSAAQGGIDLTKPPTTVGTPDDGAWVDETRRVLRLNNQFTALGAGFYAQDLVQIAQGWKLLGGLRYDYMKGDYDAFALANNVPAPVIQTSYEQQISKWSRRFGVMFQPTALHSFHLSYGTSFNTSGDTYQYSAQSANTPPESSRNIELGSKLDTADGRFSTRLALFHSTKYHERNTDPDSAASMLLLSGQRHAAGFDMDITGHLTDRWEVYASYTWIPEAEIDRAASTVTTGGNRVGDRPGLTPKHSGTVWSTYQITPRWRAGGGVNFSGKQSPADINNPGAGIWTAPGYATVDLMSEYVFNKTFTLKGNLTNAGDKLYADSLYRGHYIPGAGRLFQLTLAAKF